LNSENELPKLVRAFIAVRIPERTLFQLAQVQEQLKAKFRDVSWTRPEAMHVTLQFLGNIESARLNELADAVSRATKTFPQFVLELSGLGSFGNRVLWVGLQQGAQPLTELAQAMHEVGKGFGHHEEERAFNAHVTLGRFRQRSQGVTATLRSITPPAFEPWRVQHVELIRSELSPRGSRYTTLATFPLR
jgi:2'-5' RNA ligase